MSDYVKMFKNLLLIGAIPILLFWLAVGLSFIFFPYNIDAASTLLFTFSGTGCLIAIFMIVHNLRQIIPSLYRRWKR